MDVGLNSKSLSETNVNVAAQNEITTPPSFVSLRNKRKREDEEMSNELAQVKEDIKELKLLITSLTATQGGELKKIAPTLSEIQHSNRNIENSVSFLTAQNEEYKKKIEMLEEKTKEDRKYIVVLEDKIEELQKTTRKTSIEIKNVPKKNSETKDDLVEMTSCLAENIGCEFNKTYIRDIYRVRGKREGMRNSPIIVEMSSTLIKNDILKMSKAFNLKHKTKLCAKHLGFRTAEETPIFVTENLTAKASRLYFLGRELVKTKTYKFCWTAYGKVYVRKDETTPIILVRNEPQIQQLLQET